jgi:hypothetical protein
MLLGIQQRAQWFAGNIGRRSLAHEPPAAFAEWGTVAPHSPPSLFQPINCAGSLQGRVRGCAIGQTPAKPGSGTRRATWNTTTRSMFRGQYWAAIPCARTASSFAEKGTVAPHPCWIGSSWCQVQGCAVLLGIQQHAQWFAGRIGRRSLAHEPPAASLKGVWWLRAPVELDLHGARFRGVR